MGEADASSEVTELLEAWGGGSSAAADKLFPIVYRRLKGIAHRQLGRMAPGETLATTALVHEAYLRMVDWKRASFNDRRHFFAVASRAMRQILVDYARRASALKRGGGLPNVVLDEGRIPVEKRAAEVVALDEALGRLEALEPRLSRVVEMRFFGGLSVEEAAEVLEISPSSVKRDWRRARAFLFQALNPAGQPDSDAPES